MNDEQFKPFAWTLQDAVENNFYEVPVYQRPYKWSTNEVEALLDDIFGAYRKRAENPEDSLFVGTLFLRKHDKGSDGITNEFEVVDGQQRLATYSMLLLSLYSICRSRGLDDTDVEISGLKKCLWKYNKSQRKYIKEERLLSLSSIDKDVFSFIFDASFSAPIDIQSTIKKYTPKCQTEVNLIAMFNKIYDRVLTELPLNKVNPNEALNFLSFIQDRTQFIAIESSVSMPKVFSVFESINSKGKPLENIDLIKTYIFSVLDESDYDSYLVKWGQLIIRTDDNLADYLQTYIKAFLFYYKVSININNFRWISNQLPSIYHVSSVAEALKKLINDMLSLVDQYKLLFDEKTATSIVKKQSFATFYKLNLINGYTHPRALIFRSFCELSKGIISGDDVTRIIKSSTLFMFKFQSINGGDSKDAIPTFDSITRSYYNKDKLDSKEIEKSFTDSLIKNGIDMNAIKGRFVAMDFYSKHDLAYSVLSLLESVDTNNKNKLLFSQATMMLSHIKDSTFQLDHMLPQTPDEDNPDLKYYKKNINGSDLLCLKEGNDFPDGVFDGMEYSEFEARTLHRIGNIRLFLPQLNGEKGNEVLHLPDHQDFTTYGQIVDRCGKLAELLFNSPDLN